MGKTTAIAWTDKTFNPFWGCNKVSPGCDHCYADTFSATRAGYTGASPDRPVIWGPPHQTVRRLFGAKHWREPLGWNARCMELGIRELVFCASMADVFEFHPLLDAERAKLWELIALTPYLDWLLLTKRPQLISRMVPPEWMKGYAQWPKNVWIGTSAEDQARFNLRMASLIEIPAPVHFISAEPLLGPIDVRDAIIWNDIEWTITGGESGPGFRPMELDWVRAIRDACVQGDSLGRKRAFFHKQSAALRPGTGNSLDGRAWHQWPIVSDVPGILGGVRAAPSAQLV